MSATTSHIAPPVEGAARLLVVEDDGIVLNDVSRALEAMGYRVVAAARTGEEAVSAARDHRPDLALMDVRLAGETDGIEAGEILLEELGVPVVYLTAYADAETRRRVRGASPYGYVVKPYDDRDLQTAVEVALLRHRMDGRLERERSRLAERVKEQSCLYAVSRLLHDDDRSLEGRLRDVVRRIPAGWQYPEVTGARLRMDGETIATDGFASRGSTLRAPIEVEGERRGRIEVRYGEDRPEEDLGPFLDEERRLLDEIAGRIAVEVGRARTRERLRESERRLRQMAEAIDEVFWLRDPESREMLYVSPAFEEVWGRPAADLYEDPRLWLEQVHPEDRERVEEAAFGSEDASFEATYRIVRPDGEVRWIRDRAFPVTDGEGRTRRVAGVARDVTEEREARLASEEQRRTLERILDTAAEGIMLTDAEGDFEYANPAAERILGLEKSEIAGRTYRDPEWSICAPDGGPFPDERLPVARVLRTGEPVTGVEHGVERPDGSRIVLSVNAAPLTGPEGETTGVVASIRDVTEQKELEAQLQRRALHDYLTDLPNRALFRDRLDHALKRADRSGQRLAVCFLDLRRFKVVNDSLGHEAGDRVLKEVARRLSGAVRAEDTVARVGGDEFTVLLEEVEREEDVEEAAHRLTGAFEAPIRIGEDEIPLDASVGIAVHAPGEDDDIGPSDLVRRADAAMYRARGRPGTRYEIASAGAEEAPQSARLERETRLRRALEAGEVRTVYQPIYGAASGELRGVEALARWTDDELGEVPPGVFIPLAEETGLIVRLGEQQLERACGQLLEDGFVDADDGRPLRLHANLSARQLEDPDVVGRIRGILERTGFPPSRLCLEITESAAMHQPEVVDRLKEMGADLALDDFGTRYSTLSQLRRLKVDALKIDRTFVDGMVADERDRAIVETILTLGRSLGLGVVAEGVESGEQLELLRELGCEEAQGFHLARPCGVGALRDLLEGGRASG